ncbi:hypothetical protein F2Q70_00011650 [Brassica cretica]|uniref:Uncharacterized protein n=1 Tax=Brassica cretica TaxID=69181 RepID=A0A8S9M3L7_BRACR|nr:hypothetical protein F2Q70_00011650 [Brassica cretica]
MKWVRYGLRETASKSRRECMDSCHIDVSEELGRYVANERDVCSVATSRPSLARARSLRSDQRDKIGAAPYDGCLRTLVEGIKPFVVLLGVKVCMTSFPARPLRSGFYVEVIRRVAADGILYGCRRKTTNARILVKRQILGSRIKVLDTMPRDVRDQCAGFRARPRFSAYTTCMAGTEHLSKDNF